MLALHKGHTPSRNILPDISSNLYAPETTFGYVQMLTGMEQEATAQLEALFEQVSHKSV